MGFVAFITYKCGVEFWATTLLCLVFPGDGVRSEPGQDALSYSTMGTLAGCVQEALICHSESPSLFFPSGAVVWKFGSKPCCDR